MPTLEMHLEHGTYVDGVWAGWGAETSTTHGWQSSADAVASWRSRGVLGKPFLNGKETIRDDGIVQRVWFGDAVDTPLFELEAADV